MEHINLDFIKTYWEVISIVFVAIAATITSYVKWKGIKSNRTLRDEYMRSFEQTLTNLSSDNITARLTSAVMLRRFFYIDEMSSGNDFLKEETINVISSLLRTLPCNVFQKTVGDSLAYAKDLTKADLQKTNLQDVDLEGKNGTLIMRNCDLFMADLSHALIKNIDAEGAYFYHSILLKTSFKDSNLKNADFRCADLTNCKFERCDLYMANFDGAVNIPEEIEKEIQYHTDEKGNTSRRYMKQLVKDVKGTTKESAAINEKQKACIFFSIPGCCNIEDNATILSYKRMIEELGYETFYYTRDQYPQFGQLNKIRLEVMKSAGMIVFGLKQLKIEKGTFRPGTKEENELNMKWVHTPWNELEVGMGIMKGLPILLVKDDEIDSGIFDRHLSECFMATISSKEHAEDVKMSKDFNRWRSKIV
ncbi:MAG: pentapeptide repeat-containing protein [Bacteroidaceae bacterium]|nr:pentapeptide repeat-containing protein [Bacteroidaceae bacterium]